MLLELLISDTIVIQILIESQVQRLQILIHFNVCCSNKL